jgi:hypothetical protein
VAKAAQRPLDQALRRVDRSPCPGVVSRLVQSAHFVYHAGPMERGLSQVVISCHADTGFKGHRLRRNKAGVFYGHLDNFVGVHAVMKASPVGAETTTAAASIAVP